MKNSFKRIICAVFAFCLIVSMLSACGGSNSTSSGSSKSPHTQSLESDDSTVSYTAPSNLEVGKNYYDAMPDNLRGSTVRYATWIDHTMTEGNVPLTNMEADIGIKPELMVLNAYNYIDEVVAKIASNDIPDVVKANEGTQCFPLTLQILQPINKCSSVPLDDPLWDQTMIATATIDGNVYMVNTIGSPWSGSNLCYYNKALFAENGFKTPEEYYQEGNWTWATLEKVLKDVKALGDDYQGGVVPVEILGDSAGVSFCKYDYKTGTFSSGISDPKLVSTYETYANWRDAGLVGVATYQDFMNGKAGIVLTGVYGLKNNGHFMNMDFDDIGFTYLPAINDSEKGLTSSIYRMYGVCAQAPNADAAGWFIRYWLDPEKYDLDNTFISKRGGNFYYELTNNPAENKYFNFDDGCASFVGSDSSNVFIRGAQTAPAAQVNTKIQAVANVVNEACKGANDLIQSVKDKYK